MEESAKCVAAMEESMREAEADLRILFLGKEKDEVLEVSVLI